MGQQDGRTRMETIDFKKVYRTLYSAPQGKPTIVEVPDEVGGGGSLGAVGDDDASALVSVDHPLDDRGGCCVEVGVGFVEKK